MAHAPSRRRFIGISAAAAGLALLPAGRAAHAQENLVTWQGTALGADAVMQIHHPVRATADRLIGRALNEVRRLGYIFSLYEPTSSLNRLNRAGVLEGPPPELVELLTAALHYAEVTGGAFDPTVQPLWTLYLDHFSAAGADPSGPSPQARAAALARVGYQRVSVDADRIVMPRGTALTLNGIAQGYVTDRIVALLRSEGLDHSLVDMGETRVLGSHPLGRPWQVAIADPAAPGRTVKTLPAVDQAVATSGAYGFVFDPDGRLNHLFDPHSGQCASRYGSVTTVLPTATAADALSTAFSLMPREDIVRTLAAIGGGQVHLLGPQGFETLTA
ncbi:FAD:protein FMN transferase [Azorhizobium doebereinerae]|uniref:FAD:protein FMN transferase n=1 Tax=Azorhizobium doebereinerae TaxID=281091 RepID=UPI00042305C5|nr:FAD:protein FMN transferase [Azorhizobium doebereinerae]